MTVAQVKARVSNQLWPAADTPSQQQYLSAKFLAQQSALTSRICSMVEQDVSRSLGEATMTERHRARDIATFSRLREYRNSICRGRSSPEDVAIEISTTAASLALKSIDRADPITLGQAGPL